jgi:hypothetical protein
LPVKEPLVATSSWYPVAPFTLLQLATKLLLLMIVAAVAVGGEGTPGAASTVTTKFVPTKPYGITKNHAIAATRLIRGIKASIACLSGLAQITR